LNIGSVKNVVNEIDGAAFIVIHQLEDAVCGIIKKTDLL